MQNEMVNVTIDGEKLRVEAGTRIIDAAEQVGVKIPRLCYHPKLSLLGACRVCIVEVAGRDTYVAACANDCLEGMEIRTNSPEIRQARRDIIELLLDNHPKECQTCERDGNCELQNLAYSHGVRERLFEGERAPHEIDNQSKSVIRNQNKCIKCGRCIRVCHEIQNITNLTAVGRGFDIHVSPAYQGAMDESVCIQCGQCINVCPTAAFLEQNHTERVWEAIADPDTIVIAQVAPSIRAAIGEAFDMAPGYPATGETVTALRKLGFDLVFDTDFSADLTIMEEANEFIERLNGKGKLPMLTSCSPGWVNFLEKFYPEMIPNASSCKSPMSMLSTLAKTYFAEKENIDPKKIYMVGIMPCVAKKYEMARKEHYLDENTPYTDAVLTTRELAWMIKCYGIDFTKLEKGEFDAPMGLASGAGDIFGTTGGVMEAALRTAIEKITGEPADRIDYTEVRAVEGLREATLDVNGKYINIAVANGLKNAKKILDKVKKGEKEYHLIELMACPGGCIGGGGQPYPPYGFEVLDPKLLKLRASALYTIDTDKKLRKSHENPAIIKIYEDFLEKPGSSIAHKLLHTSYQEKSPRGII